jgi:signal transduction histidine kinase
VALFRIVQEAVNNAIRHGQSNNITVRIARSGQSLCIEVEDDGRGLADIKETAGHGIDNMRTRARLIAARFEIGSNPAGRREKNGTRMRLTLSPDFPVLVEV